MKVADLIGVTVIVVGIAVIVAVIIAVESFATLSGWERREAPTKRLRAINIPGGEADLC